MTLAEVLARQRRFRLLLVSLVALALVIGMVIVPIEGRYSHALITNFFDGIWWTTQTISSVGYGDVYPVTNLGKLLGMILEISGVLTFGLLVSMVTVALDDAKEKYHRHQLNERLDAIDSKLDSIEKRQNFVVKREVSDKE